MPIWVLLEIGLQLLAQIAVLDRIPESKIESVSLASLNPVFAFDQTGNVGVARLLNVGFRLRFGTTD